MIRSLKAFYMVRLLREKLLLTGLAVLGAGIWASSFGERAARLGHAAKATTGILSEQAFWLAHRSEIEASAQAAAGRLDAVRTLDATRLLAEVSAIAGEAGLKNTSGGESKDDSNGQFAVHTLQFSIAKVDWGSLSQFYLALSKRSPYIGIEQFSVQSDRANPALLNATFRISSVEIARN